MKQQQETKLKIIYTNANGITGKINSLQAVIYEYDCNIYAVLQKPNSKDNLHY